LIRRKHPSYHKYRKNLRLTI